MTKPRQLRLRVLCGHLLLAALLCVQVQGHGYMSVPPSRNWRGRNINPVITYTPHGGNGRGESKQLLTEVLTSCRAVAQLFT